MNSRKSIEDGLKSMSVSKISTDGATAPVQEDCHIAIEAPLTIDVEGVGAYTVLCTPVDKRAMAVGFLFGEGIIDQIGDIALLNECIDDPNVIRVKRAEAAPKADGARNLLIVSSCGLCGSESIEERLSAMPKAGNTLKLRGELLRRASAALSERQEIFRACGGTHAAGIFTGAGEMVAFAEDIGRHNALDKAIGKCLLAGKPPRGLAAALSGRVSLEMVGKCARAGIELISAVSAPTSLGLEAARHCNITLCCFVRDVRATIFTGSDRILT